MAKKQTLPHDLLRRCIAVKVGARVRPVPPRTLDDYIAPWKPGATRARGLEAKMKAGDELWTWSTAEDGAVETLAERGGYAVVRRGKVIDYVNDWMS